MTGPGPLAARIVVVLAATLLVASVPTRAWADHDGVSCEGGGVSGEPAVRCVHLHGAAPDVLDALAVKVADEIAKRQLQTNGTYTAEVSVPEPLRVTTRETDTVTVGMPVDEDWRYAGLFAGGSVLVMLAALVVAQLKRRA